MQLLSEYFRAWLVKVVKSRKEFRFYFLDNKIIFRELFRLRAAAGNVPFHHLLAITILLMLHYWTISVSNHQAIINHTAVIRQGSHQARQSSDSHQAVIRQSSGSHSSCQTVNWQLSLGHQAVVRQSLLQTFRLNAFSVLFIYMIQDRGQ